MITKLDKTHEPQNKNNTIHETSAHIWTNKIRSTENNRITTLERTAAAIIGVGRGYMIFPVKVLALDVVQAYKL